MSDTDSLGINDPKWHITEPAFHFMKDVSHMFGFMQEATSAVDLNENVAAALNKMKHELVASECRSKIIEMLPDHDPEFMYKGVAKHRLITYFGPTMGTLILCGVVDRFLLYLAGLMELVFQHGEGAKIAIAEKYESVRQFLSDPPNERPSDEVANCVAQLILRRTGVGIHAVFWKDIFGIELYEIIGPKGKKYLRKLIGIRNIHVHNRGILNTQNRDYLSEYQVGQKVELTLDETLSSVGWLMQLVGYLDEQIPDKLGLPKTRSLREDPVMAEMFAQENKEPENNAEPTD